MPREVDFYSVCPEGDPETGFVCNLFTWKEPSVVGVWGVRQDGEVMTAEAIGLG